MGGKGVDSARKKVTYIQRRSRRGIRQVEGDKEKGESLCPRKRCARTEQSVKDWRGQKTNSLKKARKVKKS